MTETRYFIFNHEKSFSECELEGLRWESDSLRPITLTALSRLSLPVLDSGSESNVWQRVLADITLGESGRVVWRLCADNHPGVTSVLHTEYTIENADDFIPIGVCGRYLKLTAELTGDVTLRSLTVYESRESFLDYLPEIYREYNGFLDRYLHIFAAQYLEMERQIEKLPGTFDPAVASDTTLRWLAELVGIRNIHLWETEGLRSLLSSGIYRRHGQFSVFAEYIEYFTGYKPYIVENYKYITGIPEHDRLYAGADLTVFLPPESAGINEQNVRLIINDFLPSDIVCHVFVLDPYPVVGGAAIVGVNTGVGRYEPTVVGLARVGVTVLGGKA